MKKIMRLSRFLKIAAILIAALLPIYEAGYWITEGYPFIPLLAEELPQYANDFPITWSHLDGMQRFLGFLIGLLPMAFSMAALIFLAKIFGAFQRGELFARKNAAYMKKAGWMLIGGQLVYPLYLAGLSLILTYRNPPGHRMLSIALGNTEIQVVLIGVAVLLIASILERAADLHEDQTGTI